MDRVFLDANVLFSAAYHATGRLGRLWELADVTLITSSYAAAEALRNITRKFPDRLPALNLLLSKTALVAEATTTKLPTGVSLSDKDVPILLAAIDAKATQLLTGDHDFDGCFGRTISGVEVLLPSEYLQRHGK